MHEIRRRQGLPDLRAATDSPAQGGTAPGGSTYLRGFRKDTVSDEGKPRFFHSLPDSCCIYPPPLTILLYLPSSTYYLVVFTVLRLLSCCICRPPFTLLLYLPSSAYSLVVFILLLSPYLQALLDLNGRFFGGREVKASFYDETKFKNHRLEN